jgi:hypothetical protein
MGSCFRVKFGGKVAFDEIGSVCADASNRGSVKSALSRRDPEINLILGAIDFLHISAAPKRYFRFTTSHFRFASRVYQFYIKRYIQFTIGPVHMSIIWSALRYIQFT